MRKSILFGLLSIVAVVAVACGGGNNTANKGNGGNAAGNGGDNAAACGGSACGGDACGGSACGGDNSTSSVDPYALYKKKGRTWITKNEMDAGGTKMVTFSKTEVVEVADDHAMIKMWTLDKDKKPMAGMPEPTPTKISFAKAEPAKDGTAKAPEPTKETVEVPAGKFECYVTDTNGTKSWSSVEYPGLPVKMESKTMKTELVEFTK